MSLLLLAGCGASVSGNGGGMPTSVAAPAFSPRAGVVSAGTVVTISSSTVGATLYVGKTNPPTAAGSSFSVDAAGTWYAQASLNGRLSAVSSAAYTITSSTPPAAPTGLAATAASSATIGLTWTDASGDETGFRVEQAPDSGGSPGTFAEVGTTAANVTSYTATRLTALTTYWYRVRAYNGAGTSAYSGTAHATTSAPPTSLQFTSTTCPPATQGSTYSCTLTADGGTPPYAYSVVSSSGYAPLPEGMALAGSGAITSSRVGGQGKYIVQFQVADAASRTAQAEVTLAIAGSNAYLSSVFPADSIFHHRLDSLPVDTSPAAPLYSAYQSAHLRLLFGAWEYLNLPQGIPVIDVEHDQPEVQVHASTSLYYGTDSEFTSGPIPAYAPVEGTSASFADGGDTHVLVYRHSGAGTTAALYEMWRAIHDQGTNSWTVSGNAHWSDVDGYALAGSGSADAAGLPIAPLLLNADEVIGAGTPTAPAGEVRHPVRFTVNHILNYWVWPGTATAGVGSCTDSRGNTIATFTRLSQSNPPASCTMSGPAGQIYRLKASVPTPVCAATSPQAAIIITGFRQYGIILADNGLTGGLIGTPDTRWNDDDLSCLTNLTLSDFEPVNVSSLMVDSNSSRTNP